MPGVFAANLPSRISRRVSSILQQSRIKFATSMLGSGEFEFWGRYSDEIHQDLEPLRDTWLERGRVQFEFLKSQGLQPHHRFLDYGCAFLATASHVAPYLDRGNYVGVDVAQRAVQRGVRRMSDFGLDRSRYHVLRTNSPRLGELDGFAFDVIFAFSTLQYLRQSDFEMVTRRFKDLLLPGGICYVTYSEPELREDMQRKGMRYYGAEEYRAAFSGSDFSLVRTQISLDDPSRGKLLAIRRSPSKATYIVPRIAACEAPVARMLKQTVAL